MSGAVISACGAYRYTLRREISCILRWVRPCLFVMLNPSTADAQMDDPTIRRCISFAKRESCSSLTVVNLFALRATDPRELARHPDPVGPENDRHLAEQMAEHRLGIVIAAWGNHPMAGPRVLEVLHRLSYPSDLLPPIHALGLTQGGSPRHPLYVRGDQPLVRWPGPARSRA